MQTRPLKKTFMTLKPGENFSIKPTDELGIYLDFRNETEERVYVKNTPDEIIFSIVKKKRAKSETNT